MSPSRPRNLRRKLVEWGLLALCVLVPAVAGTIILDDWFPNWGKYSEEGPVATFGGPPGAGDYILHVVLKPGSRAPKLDAESLDGSESFHLDDYRGVKPVVLVFGSMSCNLFQIYAPNLEKVYQEYKDRAVFAFINIHEAGHRMEGYEYLLEGQDDREGHARCVRQAMRQVHLSLPGFNDSSDNAALRNYGAFPARLVIVDVNGRIARDFDRVLARAWHWPTVRKVLDEQCARSTVALH